MKLTSVVVTFLTLSALAPAAATAQVTTFVAPARPKADSANQVVAAAQKARSDSTARMTLTNMKAWVDSAAGISVAANTSASDTTAVAADTAQRTTTRQRTTTTFSSGAIAPNTASPLPLLLLSGALLALAGGLLLTSGRPAKLASVRRRR